MTTTDRNGARPGAAPDAEPGAEETAQAARAMAAQRRRPGGGPPWAAFGHAHGEGVDFGPSARRLAARLAPERLEVLAVLVLGVVSVALSVLGPEILGHATDLMFTGVLGRRLPAGTTTEQAVAARAPRRRHARRPAVRMDVVPGVGIDFTALGACCCSSSPVPRRPRRWPSCRATCSTASCSARCCGCAPRSRTSCTGCRWRYFDAQPRGELLSRVTNDIDNISQSLQQTISQLLTSLLTSSACW